MTTDQVDAQRASDEFTEKVDLSSSEEEVAERKAVPTVKSGTYNDPNPTKQTGRFTKRDTVHMSLIQSGVRTKGTFAVAKARQHPSGGYWEYQLKDGSGNAYKNGAWIRDKDLRLEKRG